MKNSPWQTAEKALTKAEAAALRIIRAKRALKSARAAYDAALIAASKAVQALPES